LHSTQCRLPRSAHGGLICAACPLHKNGCLSIAPDRARPGDPAHRRRCERRPCLQRYAWWDLMACPPCVVACRAEPLGRMRRMCLGPLERRHGSVVTPTLTSALRLHAGRRLLCDGVLCPATDARRGDQGTQAARPAARTLQQSDDPTYDANPTRPPNGRWSGARSKLHRSACQGAHCCGSGPRSLLLVSACAGPHKGAPVALLSVACLGVLGRAEGAAVLSGGGRSIIAAGSAVARQAA